MPVASKRIQDYFSSMEKSVQTAYKVASDARKKGFDPEPVVDIVLTKNMAQRVEGLISVVAPKIKGSGITKRIQELEKKYGALAWEVALLIAEDVAKEKFCKFSDKKEAMEIGIRAGFAYHTLGIVSAPLEGLIEIKIKKRRDGKEYVAAKYAGPIRGAGGTAAAVSVLITDYIRKIMGYDTYDPTENEINRAITELGDYHERVTNLQYYPSKDELVHLLRHLPVEVDGDPTEDITVSNYKDLPRIETNRIRSGVCLVISMMALKAPKLWKRISKLSPDFGIDWSFLDGFLKIQKRMTAHEKKEDVGKSKKLSPNYAFISDLVAGRPVLTHPLAAGGLRLRYGRTRTSGLSSASIHPATMHVLNKYIATGTQLKMERPGKAAAITPCDTIDGPIVKLKSGDVLFLETEAQAQKVTQNIAEILFLGDLLLNYGDFSENNHFLIPPGYCEEWWILELEKAVVDYFGSFDLEKLAGLVKIPQEQLALLFKNPLTKISARAALELSTKLAVPFHPRYTYHWKGLPTHFFPSILQALSRANIIADAGGFTKLVLPLEKKSKRALELLGIPHTVASNQFVVLDMHNSTAFLASLGICSKKDVEEKLELLRQQKTETQEHDNILSVLNNANAKLKLRDKSGTFIGSRMGRPEKSKIRKLTGSPHVLFPVGAEGGKLRSFQSALDVGKIRADFPMYFCAKDNHETIYPVCELCGRKTKKRFICSECGATDHTKCFKGGVNGHSRGYSSHNYRNACGNRL